MRVAERETSDRAALRGRAHRFDAVLRDARREGGRHRPVSARLGAEVPPAQALGTRRSSADRATSVLRERRGSFGESERQGPAPVSAQAAPPPLSPARADSIPALRALVRTLPVAIEAARVREGAPLSLALGRALSVDLRRGADGLEVVLRPDAALGRAADAELPALVAALRERGIAVARAEVWARADGNPPARRPPR